MLLTYRQGKIEEKYKTKIGSAVHSFALGYTWVIALFYQHKQIYDKNY